MHTQCINVVITNTGELNFSLEIIGNLTSLQDFYFSQQSLRESLIEYKLVIVMEECGSPLKREEQVEYVAFSI